MFLNTIWESERAKLMEMKDVTEGLVATKVWNDDTIKPAGPTMESLGTICKEVYPNFSGYVRDGFLDAWMSAMMATKAFEIVIDAGKEVNGDNLAEALRSVKDWDTGGIVDSPVTITNQQIGLARLVTYSEANNWDLKDLSGWMKVT